MKTVVIGLGNPILSDDGAGIVVARAVRHALPPKCKVDVLELSVGGIRLMEAMCGYERAILIDAMWSEVDGIGKVLVFDASHLPETLNIHSSHDAELPTALNLGRVLNAPLPHDEDIHIVAITANRVLDFGEQLSAPVQDAVSVACDAVLGLL